MHYSHAFSRACVQYRSDKIYKGPGFGEGHSYFHMFSKVLNITYQGWDLNGGDIGASLKEHPLGHLWHEDSALCTGLVRAAASEKRIQALSKEGDLQIGRKKVLEDMKEVLNVFIKYGKWYDEDETETAELITEARECKLDYNGTYGLLHFLQHGTHFARLPPKAYSWLFVMEPPTTGQKRKIDTRSVLPVCFEPDLANHLHMLIYNREAVLRLEYDSYESEREKTPCTEAEIAKASSGAEETHEQATRLALLQPTGFWAGKNKKGQTFRLRESYVEANFASFFLTFCRRNPNAFLRVPPGGPCDRSHLMTSGTGPKQKYMQGNELYCAPYALANALYAMGLDVDAACIARLAPIMEHTHLEYINLGGLTPATSRWVWRSYSDGGTCFEIPPEDASACFSPQLRKVCQEQPGTPFFVGEPLHPMSALANAGTRLKLWQVALVAADERGACRIGSSRCMQLVQPPINCISLVQLLDSDMNDSHCVAVAGGLIFDATESHALSYSPASLDRCCTPNRYTGVVRSLTLKPMKASKHKVQKVIKNRALPGFPALG